MITTTKETLWKVIRKYNEYKEIDEQLAADYINQWIIMEDSKYEMEQNVNILDNIEKELEAIRQKEDIIDKINKVDTHLCSKLNYQTIDNKKQSYCMQSGEPTACLGMKMFCPFEEEFKKEKEKMLGVSLVQKMDEIKKRGTKQKMKSKLENDLKIETYNVNENCEHYLPGQQYCLWCGAKVKCEGNRVKCESSMEKRIEEMCVQMGIQNGKVNGYLIKDGLVVGKE